MTSRGLKLDTVDARAIVPIRDAIGGVAIYAAGRPAYYVLEGEWFEAVPEPGPPSAGPESAPAGPPPVDPARPLRVS